VPQQPSESIEDIAMTAASRTLSGSLLLVLCVCSLESSAICETLDSPRSLVASPQTSSSSKSPHRKYSHQNDFLVHGTVFTEQGLSFPGVELKIRRTDEKKFRWDAYTNSRGEFAVRVPQGTEYEIVVRAKGFTAQTKTVNAKDAGNDDVLVFRMAIEKDGKR
jgi:hypothetical protein